MHVHAVAKNPASYEHIDPALVGNERRILVSELSGQSTILAKTAKYALQHDRALMQQDPQPGAGPGERGLPVRGGRGVVRPAGEEGAGPVPAEVRAPALPRQHRGRRATASRSPRRRSRCSVGDAVEHTVSEGDGPVNALDGALRKALLPVLPAAGRDAPGRLQGPRRQRPRRHRRPRPRRHRMRATRRTSGARSASARTSSRRAGWRWSTLEYKLFKDEA